MRLHTAPVADRQQMERNAPGFRHFFGVKKLFTYQSAFKPLKVFRFGYPLTTCTLPASMRLNESLIHNKTELDQRAALGMHHPISPKYPCKCLIIKESVCSQYKSEQVMASGHDAPCPVDDM